MRSENKYTPYSAIIKVTKDKEKSQSSFISMGTFILENEKLVYKEFQSQQLIQLGTEISKDFVNVDKIDYKIDIVDSGLNLISAKVLLNKSTEVNSMSCKYFLPYYEKSKLILTGIKKIYNI